MRTLADLFLRGLEAGAPGPALGSPSGDPPGSGVQFLTRDEVARRVGLISAGLAALGFRQGDRLGIYSENRVEWALVDYAALCAGLVVVPLYSSLSPDLLRFVLADSGARAVVAAGDEQAAAAAAARSDLPALEQVIVAGAAPLPGTLSLAAVEERGADFGAGRPGGLREHAAGIGPADVASLVYTSGTTGRPKGVILTHRNLVSNVESAMEALPLLSTDLALSLLPLSHIFERTVDYSLWRAGARIVYCPHLGRAPELLRTVRPTFFAGVPRLYEKVHTRVEEEAAARGRAWRGLFRWSVAVLERTVAARRAGRPVPLSYRPAAALADRLVGRRVRDVFGGRVRVCMSGGAPLRPELCRFFWAMGVPLYPGYGLTEASPILTTNRPGDVRCATVGPPLPGVEIRLAEDGEILARGENVTPGYWNRPEETAALLAGGWLHTGDLGRLDEHRHLTIVGRKKEILVTSGGENVAPAPIEGRIRSSPYVEEAVLVGDGRRFVAVLLVPARAALSRWAASRGLAGLAWEELLARPETTRLFEREVTRHCEGLSRHERPKRVGLLPRSLRFREGELTVTAKVRREVVAANFAPIVTRIYEEIAPSKC